MTAKVPSQIVPMLYRNMLKAARDYGRVAEKKKLPALEEIYYFNKTMKLQNIKPRNSLYRRTMTPFLAQSIVRLVFRNPKASKQNSKLLLDDGFAALKKLNQKFTVLYEFPNDSEREHTINGMKVEAKCRFVAAVPSGREKQNYHYQIYFKFTNCTPQTLKVLDEHILTKDETLREIKRDERVINGSFLLGSGTYEHVTALGIQTESGSCTCKYVFVNTQTGTLIHVPVPPLLLSTHDPDMAHRETPYRGDPNADIYVEVQSYQADVSHTDVERSPSENGESKQWLNRDVTNLTYL